METLKITTVIQILLQIYQMKLLEMSQIENSGVEAKIAEI